MKIDDILNSLPSKEELANAVGGQTRNAGGDLLPALGIFGAGLLLGAGLAFLFAPSSGRQLRHDLAERVGGFGHTLAEGDQVSTDGPAEIPAA
jgi:hypothetical protein